MHPYACPLASTRLKGLPPTLIVSIASDPLHDEADAYVAKLAAAGVQVETFAMAGPTDACVLADAEARCRASFGTRPSPRWRRSSRRCPEATRSTSPVHNGLPLFHGPDMTTPSSSGDRGRRPPHLRSRSRGMPASRCWRWRPALPFAFAGCGETDAQTAASPAPPAAPVSVAAALERDVVETQEFSGRIEAVDRADIRPRVSGTIDAIRFVPGRRGEEGRRAGRDRPAAVSRRSDRADAAAASAVAKTELAKTQLERSKRLVADNAIATRDYDERVANTKQLDADARAARASADAAKLNLTFTQVRAPIAGRVSKAEVTAGNLVDPTVVLTSVVSSDPIYASFDGDEQTFARLGGPARALNTTVRVGLVGEDGFPHVGKLEFIDNRVDPGTGSVRMRALLDNHDGLIAAGRFARVSIGGGEKTSKVVLIATARSAPTRTASSSSSRRRRATTARDFKADYRAVKLGPVIDGLRVVRSGLKPGEQIVVNGLQRVRPGAPIAPQVVPMDAPVARGAAPDETSKTRRAAPGVGKKDAAPAR